MGWCHHLFHAKRLTGSGENPPLDLLRSISCTAMRQTAGVLIHTFAAYNLSLSHPLKNLLFGRLNIGATFPAVRVRLAEAARRTFRDSPSPGRRGSGMRRRSFPVADPIVADCCRSGRHHTHPNAGANRNTARPAPGSHSHCRRPSTHG